MLAILTGDVINSREATSHDWLEELKSVLNQYGKSPRDWEISRGDSFQLKSEPSKALIAALHIKACIRQFSGLDVRISIGLGEESYKSKRISESNGSAYVRSGEGFESLKKNTLIVHSGRKEADEVMNLMLRLTQLTANQWKSTTSQVVKTAIENPDKNQVEIAEILSRAQSSISEALNRGGYDEMMQLNSYFESKYLKA